MANEIEILKQISAEDYSAEMGATDARVERFADRIADIRLLRTIFLFRKGWLFSIWCRIQYRKAIKTRR